MRRVCFLLTAVVACCTQAAALGCSNLTAPAGEDRDDLPQLQDRGGRTSAPKPPPSAAEPRRDEKAVVQRILIAWKGADGADEKVTRSEDEARKLAIEVAEKARGGSADFAQLARTHSDAPEAKDGGQLPPIERGGQADSLTKAVAFRLRPGQISGVLNSPNGFMIMKRVQ